jgi:hypothetical protein
VIQVMFPAIASVVVSIALWNLETNQSRDKKLFLRTSDKLACGKTCQPRTRLTYGGTISQRFIMNVTA